MSTVLSFNNTHFVPSKIVCAGRNYVAHIEELGNEVPDQLVVFNKPPSAISDKLMSTLDEPLHYEGELAFMVTAGELAAVGFGLDLTKRELQSRLKAKGLPWERAKAFDGAALFSEFVAFTQTNNCLQLKLWVDGELRQHGGVDLMLHSPKAILDELSQYTSLEDGDIIMTGTPAGTGMVNAGQTFVGEVYQGDNLLVSKQWSAQ